MKNPPFTYHRPDTLDEALGLLATHGDTAKVLAGGQSLLPVLALRLGRPDHVVDIGRLPGLADITVADDHVAIGALVTHAQAERSGELATHAPLVHQAMPHVGHRAIRTRGTVCGSVAHADPAAELPAVCLATGATVVARSAEGVREIPAGDFFEGYLQTALRPDEILTAVRLPRVAPGTGTALVEESRRHGDYAMVGLACSLRLDGDTVTDVALAFFGASATPVRVPEAEAVLDGSPPTADIVAEAATTVSAHLDPPADLHASANYRRHVAGVLTRRAVQRAVDAAGGQLQERTAA